MKVWNRLGRSNNSFFSEMHIISFIIIYLFAHNIQCEILSSTDGLYYSKLNIFGLTTYYFSNNYFAVRYLYANSDDEKNFMIYNTQRTDNGIIIIVVI